MKNQEFEQAEAIFRRILKRLNKLKPDRLARRPELVDLRETTAFTLANLLKKQKAYDEALELCQQFVNSNDQFRWLHEIAMLKADKGDIQASVDELRALAVMHPDKATVWLSLGIVLLKLDDQEEAMVNLKRAIDRDDDKYSQFMASTTLFNKYEMLGRYDEALDMWHAIVEKTGVENHYVLYNMYLKNGNLVQAEYWLKKEENPLLAGLFKGLIAKAKGDTEAMTKIWEKTVDLSPFMYKSGHAAWAETALRIGHDANDIVNVLHELRKDGELAFPVLFMLALAEIKAGNTTEAHELFDSLITEKYGDRIIDTHLRPLEDWHLFIELFSNEEIQAEFKKYFKLDENGDKE